MKHVIASPQRRQFLIAGLAGIAAPAVVFATQEKQSPPGAPRGGEPLIVSGRIVTVEGKPLQGATIEFLHDGRQRLATDADGRFMAHTAAPNGGQLAYRVVHDVHGVHRRSHALARVAAHRDDNGVWRATFGAVLA